MIGSDDAKLKKESLICVTEEVVECHHTAANEDALQRRTINREDRMPTVHQAGWRTHNNSVKYTTFWTKPPLLVGSRQCGLWRNTILLLFIVVMEGHQEDISHLLWVSTILFFFIIVSRKSVLWWKRNFCSQEDILDLLTWLPPPVQGTGE